MIFPTLIDWRAAFRAAFQRPALPRLVAPALEPSGEQLERQIREQAAIAKELGDGPEALQAWIEVARLKSLRSPETTRRLDAERLKRARQRDQHAV